MSLDWRRRCAAPPRPAGCHQPATAAAVETLAAPQLAHLVVVSLEYVNVYHRRGVTTDVAASYAKVVDHLRGGWCFQLNGALAWLLRELGYEVDLVSCRVWGDAEWGPPLDHLDLVVHIEVVPGWPISASATAA